MIREDADSCRGTVRELKEKIKTRLIAFGVTTAVVFRSTVQFFLFFISSFPTVKSKRT
jgi:predicted tellurium resistance membrane protein TerC